MRTSEARFTCQVNHAFLNVNYALRMRTVADRIKALRKALDVTQQGMGDLARVSKSAVSQWERGITEPEWEALRELQRAKRVNPSWVSHGDGEMFLDKRSPSLAPGKEKASDDVLGIIADLMSDASPRSRQILVGLVEAAERGELSEDDLVFIEQVANRIKR